MLLGFSSVAVIVISRTLYGSSNGDSDNSYSDNVRDGS